jgi:hypothetical protein
MLSVAKKDKKPEVPSDIRKKIKKRHPDAGIKEMHQFMAVFDGAKNNGESDSRAYAKAWGVLNQNKNLGDSHRETDKAETKKKINKWEKKNKWKGKKKDKKSSISYDLQKLAGVLELLGESKKSEKVHDMAKQMKEVFHTSNDPETEPCKTPGSVFHIFVEDNEVGARVNLPFSLELEEEEYQELENNIHDALEEILSKYFEETDYEEE